MIMNNTLDSSGYEIIRNESSESSVHLSDRLDKQVSKITSEELLQVPSQSIKVYLRFKPENDCENKLQDETYSVVRQSTLVTKFSNIVKKCARNMKKSKSRDNSIVVKKIKFTRIFDSDASQEIVFEESVKPDITNFLSGQNFTVITYGTTNSGKTYTLFGTNSDPGIISRCIDYIFMNIDVASVPKFEPVNGNKVVLCCESDDIQTATELSHSKVGEKKHMSSEIHNSANFKSRDHEFQMIHSIWLSFGEIYNEAVYDLLNEDYAGKDTRLKLVPDKDGTFVKGLRIVHAASVTEAHQILTAAISKLRVATSSFNQQSSRSHAIFAIKLLRYQEGASAEQVKVSTLSFYDLAGSGRLDNPNENKQIFAESRYINKSLLALNRCMKIIYENHATKHNSEVNGPFRESCLTRLLQKTLCDKEALTVFINLNTTPTFYVETQNILSLAVSLRKALNGDMKYSSKVEDSGMSSVSRGTSNWDVFSEHVKNSEENVTNDELRRENEILMKKLADMKCSAFEHECLIRQEFTDIYKNMIKEHDDNWRTKMEIMDKEREELLKISIRQVEEYYEQKLSEILKNDENEAENIKSNDQVSEKFCDNKCESMIESLQEVIKQLKKDLENAVAEKNDSQFTLTLIKKELDDLKNARKSISFLQNSCDLEASIKQSKKSILESIADSKKSKHSQKDSEKYDEIEELHKQLLEKDQKLKELKCNLTQSEISKLDLSKKLIDMEQSLMNENINFNVSNSNNEYNLSEVKSISCIINEEDLSFLFSNLEIEKSPKIVARIPKEKFSLLSEGDNCWVDSMEKILHSTMSSDSSKNDSGVTSEGFKSDNEEKDKVNYMLIQNKMMQLKNEYNILKEVHESYRLKIKELSKELETIKHLMFLLKETASDNEQKLSDYEQQLLSKEQEIQRLRKDKENFQDNFCQTCAIPNEQSKEYLKSLNELNERLKMHEENEFKVSRFFEEYKEKAVSLENQLSNACAQFEKTSSKCCVEHIPKIEKLEEKLVKKHNRILELEKYISELKQDWSSLKNINEKIVILENEVKKYKKQEEELNNCHNAKIRNQIFLESKVQNLLIIMMDQEKTIEKLKIQLDSAVEENLTNNKNVNRLEAEILNSTQKMDIIQNELIKTEENRINFEKILQNEVANLHSGPLISVQDAAYLNSMEKEMELKQLEINELKTKLEQQNEDLCLLRKNKIIFAEKYKLFVEKLRNGEEVQIQDNILKLNCAVSRDNDENLIPSDDNNNPELQNEIKDQNVLDQSTILVVKSSNISTSLTSESSSDFAVKVKNVDISTPVKKSHSLCWMQ